MGKIEHIHVAQDGTPTTAAYVLRYDENQWNKYNEQQQRDCYDAWIKKAEPLPCERVVLILIPDPIFPATDKEYPYVAWQHKFERSKSKGYRCFARVRIVLDSDFVELDIPTRHAIELELRNYPKGTQYVVVDNIDVESAKILLEGKV